MSAGRNLEAVKEKLSEQFLQREPDTGVAGVGIGQDDAGQPVLVVHLDGRNPEARSRVQQAQWKEVAALDRVAREVVEAHTQARLRKEQIATAQGGVEAAIASYERNLERIKNVQGLPIEVLQSIQALAQARREYLRSLVAYNEAQFRLQRALGWPVDVR